MPPTKFEELTEEQIKAFTMDGKARVEHQFIDQTTSTSQEEINENYSKEKVEHFFEKARNREVNYYGPTDMWLYSALDAHPIKDKNVLIIGSTQPWYEVISLQFGAKSVTVEEYSDRPQWHEKVKYKNLIREACILYDRYPTYDAIISVSSFEHSGLGRYGDPLDPDGDLNAMSGMLQKLNFGGKLYLSVPVAADALVWNAHRVYGAERLPRLLDGWKVTLAAGWDPYMMTFNRGTNADYQPVFVLEAR